MGPHYADIKTENSSSTPPHHRHQVDSLLLITFANSLDPDQGLALSGSKLFHTLMVFLKEFFEKVDFEKNQQKTKEHAKLNSRQ